MSKKSGANKQNLDNTRALFLNLATDEFSKYGYADASTDRIVKLSGMARGSLYYHFNDKRDLFRAVYIKSMHEMADDLRNAYNNGGQYPRDKFMALARQYFAICADPIAGRIPMVESLAVLDGNDRHQITNETIRPILADAIGDLAKDGGFNGQNRNMIAMFLFSTLTESGRIISVLPNAKATKDQFFQTFEMVLAKII